MLSSQGKAFADDMIHYLYGPPGRLLQWALVAFFSLGLPTAAQVRPLHIVAFGDSLMAGYLLPEKDSFPARLEQKLRAAGYDVRVTNAGVSGDTASDGAERVDWSVPDDTDLVLLELGANDMLRGLAPDMTRAALAQILARLQHPRANKICARILHPRASAYPLAIDVNGVHSLDDAEFNFSRGIGRCRRLGLRSSDGCGPTCAWRW